MKAFVAATADKTLTFYAKMVTKTGCFFGCNAPEAPEELFK